MVHRISSSAALVIGLSAGAFLLAIAAYGVGGNAVSYAAKLKPIVNRPSDGPVVATVNGLGISQRRLDFEVAGLEANGQAASPAAALESLVQRFAVLTEAQRRGITVSTADIQEFAREQRAIADADPNRTIHGYAATLGIGYDAIWRHPLVVAAWREQLTIGALKQSVTASVPGDMSNGDVAAKEAHWRGFVQDLRAKAVVVKVSP